MEFGFRKSDWMDDWYVLDGAPGGQPEGTAEHWRNVIAAMRAGKIWYETRVGAWLDRSVESLPRYKVYSPRNAYGNDDCVWIGAGEVEDFCREVEAELAKYDDRVSAGMGI